MSSAETLEFYYLKDVQSRKNPNAKWWMSPPSKPGEGYRFGLYQSGRFGGKTIESNAQPEQVLEEVVQVKKNRPILTNKDILATATLRPELSRKGYGLVSVEFTPEGTKKMADFTRGHKGEILAIFYRGKLVMAATIMDIIPNGKVEIQFTDIREAQSLVDTINSGHASK